MPSMQASTALVVDAGYVRITDLGQQYLYLRKNHQPTERVVRSIIDLRQKLEALALTTDSVQAATLKGDLQETYGLLSVYTDPLLRPLLPPIPGAGAMLRKLVLSINGSVTRFNGHLVGMGAYLVPVTGPPSYNTPFLPGVTIGAVTFTGAAGDVYSMDMPLPASTGGPQFAKLYIDGAQVGRVDFPLTAVGAGFSLLHAGVPYYGALAAPADNMIALVLQ